MMRNFSNSIAALAAGTCLRFFFVLKYSAGSGDTGLYEQIATNWLKHNAYAIDVGGMLTPIDVRMPGYPGFLAAIYWLAGKTGPEARLWVMSEQVFVDLLTCVVTASLAATLVFLAFESVRPRRVFAAALWLAALCPFTANYTAVLLTETCATLFTALALLLMALQLLRFRGSTFCVDGVTLNLGVRAEWFGALAGFAAGLGTLFRPETPLLVVVALVVLGWYLLRGRQWTGMFRSLAFMCAGWAVALAPWAIRNAVTLHEVQFLSPKYAMLPDELAPTGFIAWEKTWLFRVRDCYLVSWKLNEEAIHLEDISAQAFDTQEERDRVAMLLETYNTDLTLTAEEDAGFAQLARERTERHPLRSYLWMPAARAFTMWLTPRIELLPLSGKAFPLAEAWEDDPIDQAVTIGFVTLVVVYLLLAAWGAWRLWRQPGARVAVALLVGYIVVRTAFLSTLETPEPRYVLVCFPALFALAAQVFAGKGAVRTAVARVEMSAEPSKTS